MPRIGWVGDKVLIFNFPFPLDSLACLEFRGPGCFEPEPDEFALTPRNERQDQADGFVARQ